LSYRFLDGKLVNGAPVEPHSSPGTADVIVQRGNYQCGACGKALYFEPCNVVDTQYAIGYCANGQECYDPQHTASNCRMWKVRLRVPLERLKCEVLP
jgi:hypothetical protein